VAAESNGGQASETARIVAGLKRVMKSRSVTYAQLARDIRLSEASVKRILSRATLSLQRLEQICRALDVSIQEITRLAAEHSAEAAELLSLEQESALAGDANLLACFYLLANGRTPREIGTELRADERQVRRWLVRLHALRLVELRSGLRARARTTTAIAWRKDGPVRRLYEKQVREEFLRSSFSGSGEAQHFRSAELSDASCRVFLRKLERLAAEFRDLAELDRSLPSREKRSVAVLLAARPWVFSMFESFRQPGGMARSGVLPGRAP
jgi:DNA-binding Xre family transcriptional regulator